MSDLYTYHLLTELNYPNYNSGTSFSQVRGNDANELAELYTE